MHLSMYALGSPVRSNWKEAVGHSELAVLPGSVHLARAALDTVQGLVSQGPLVSLASLQKGAEICELA